MDDGGAWGRGRCWGLFDAAEVHALQEVLEGLAVGTPEHLNNLMPVLDPGCACHLIKVGAAKCQRQFCLVLGQDHWHRRQAHVHEVYGKNQHCNGPDPAGTLQGQAEMLQRITREGGDPIVCACHRQHGYDHDVHHKRSHKNTKPIRHGECNGVPPGHCLIEGDEEGHQEGGEFLRRPRWRSHVQRRHCARDNNRHQKYVHSVAAIVANKAHDGCKEEAANGDKYGLNLR
mmetsp:Transcript_62435/g.151187  ORF Transcript_62435/g.151187 Transcript_62435/m.151187 type:complete len:230 (-) Transcript_62435:929-1618(-)